MGMPPNMVTSGCRGSKDVGSLRGFFQMMQLGSQSLGFCKPYEELGTTAQYPQLAACKLEMGAVAEQVHVCTSIDLCSVLTTNAGIGCASCLRSSFLVFSAHVFTCIHRRE